MNDLNIDRDSSDGPTQHAFSPSPPSPALGLVYDGCKKRSIFTVTSKMSPRGPLAAFHPSNASGSPSNPPSARSTTDQPSSTLGMDQLILQLRSIDDSNSSRIIHRNFISSSDNSLSRHHFPSTGSLNQSDTCRPSVDQPTLHRHSSLEDLYHPKNHRSTAGPNTVKRQRSRYFSEAKKKQRRAPSNLRSPDSTTLNLPAETSQSSENELVSLGSSRGDYPRNKELMHRIALTFALLGARKLRFHYESLWEENKLKRRESAARSILHNLLLNSWRQSKGNVEKLTKENSVHLRTIENMCLQLRVLRQMNKEEKDRSKTKDNDITELTLRLAAHKRETELLQSELKAKDAELNSSHSKILELRNDNESLKIQRENMDRVMSELQFQREQDANKIMDLDLQNQVFASEVNRIRTQLAAEEKNRNQLQSDLKIKEFEIDLHKSENVKLGSRLQHMTSSYQTLQKEILRMEESKLALQYELQKLKETVSWKDQEINDLSGQLTHTDNQVQKHIQEKLHLQQQLENERQALAEIQRNLRVFTGENIEKRRVWGSAFHYLVFPLDFVRLVTGYAEAKPRQAVKMGIENSL